MARHVSATMAHPARTNPSEAVIRRWALSMADAGYM